MDMLSYIRLVSGSFSWNGSNLSLIYCSLYFLPNEIMKNITTPIVKTPSISSDPETPALGDL